MRQPTHSLLFIEMKPTFSFHCLSDAARNNFAKMYLVSRTETFAKLFFLVSFSGLFMYVALAFYSFQTAYSTGTQMPGYGVKIQELSVIRLAEDLKYILMWTLDNNSTYEIQEGQNIFVANECADVNCYITTNKSFLNGHYEQFHAIIFNFSFLHRWRNRFFPKRRSPHQKYVFYSRLPSNKYPVCSVRTNNHFNWTWTYKFNSDIFSPFIEVKNREGAVVAPKPEVKWATNKLSDFLNDIEDMNTKTKALVWLQSECVPNERTLKIVRKLQKALEEHFLSLDIYGCGNLPCPNGGCLAAIERNYYFYLAIEQSITEDYVTDEVLLAYEHNAVPVVVGGADYTKFLPEGSYINYQHSDEAQLAALIAHTIKNPVKYREFFNWKALYTIRRVDEQAGFCQLCTLLNDNKKYGQFSTYVEFRQWWYYGSLKEKCLPKGAETFKEVFSYDTSPANNILADIGRYHNDDDNELRIEPDLMKLH